MACLLVTPSRVYSLVSIGRVQPVCGGVVWCGVGRGYVEVEVGEKVRFKSVRRRGS